MPGCSKGGDKATWCPTLKDRNDGIALCQRDHEKKLCCETCSNLGERMGGLQVAEQKKETDVKEGCQGPCPPMPMGGTSCPYGNANDECGCRTLECNLMPGCSKGGDKATWCPTLRDRDDGIALCQRDHEKKLCCETCSNLGERMGGLQVAEQKKEEAEK